MIFTSCDPALDVLTIPLISLSKPVDPVEIGFACWRTAKIHFKIISLQNYQHQKTFQKAYEVRTH